MSASDHNSTNASRGIKQTLTSIFKSPANDAYNKVLADVADQKTGDTSSLDSGLKSETLSDEEKAKRLVEQRNADSPTGHFVLGAYKPAGASQGYGRYYAAKGATGE